ncbi:MAG: hypothetical protein ACI9TV_002928 [Sulfurimonas sp.]|jgi:hypothetical protein|uniref:PKD domain-containing protein n=1 Tax=Sulfurimonas sp. TaxID=2022749 RepID=UPI0039E4F8F1
MNKCALKLLLIVMLAVSSLQAREVSLEQKISSLYISFFNRAADEDGLNYWNGLGETAADRGEDILNVLKELSSGFAAHPTFNSTYGSMGNEAFVQAIYQNSLGREGDAQGVAYWKGLLDNGKSRSDMVAEFMELSLTLDLTPENFPDLSAEDLTAAIERQDLITNKVEVALYFTKNLGSLTKIANTQDPENDPAYIASIQVLSGVESTSESVTSATNKIAQYLSEDDPVTSIVEKWDIDDSTPVANAGVDQDVNTGTTVTLDASNSSGSVGTLTYSWSITSQPGTGNATLSGASVVNPTFIADADGTYIIGLIVYDSGVVSLQDSVSVVATTPNSAPTADAGADQNVETTSLVSLDGSSSSDADPDTLTYSWNITSKPDGSTATLSSATAVSPTFTADVDGTYEISLIINDGEVDSNTSVVTVTAITLILIVPNEEVTALILKANLLESTTGLESMIDTHLLYSKLLVGRDFITDTSAKDILITNVNNFLGGTNTFFTNSVDRLTFASSILDIDAAAKTLELTTVNYSNGLMIDTLSALWQFSENKVVRTIEHTYLNGDKEGTTSNSTYTFEYKNASDGIVVVFNETVVEKTKYSNYTDSFNGSYIGTASFLRSSDDSIIKLVGSTYTQEHTQENSLSGSNHLNGLITTADMSATVEDQLDNTLSFKGEFVLQNNSYGEIEGSIEIDPEDAFTTKDVKNNNQISKASLLIKELIEVVTSELYVGNWNGSFTNSCSDINGSITIDYETLSWFGHDGNQTYYGTTITIGNNAAALYDSAIKWGTLTVNGDTSNGLWSENGCEGSVTLSK